MAYTRLRIWFGRTQRQYSGDLMADRDAVGEKIIVI